MKNTSFGKAPLQISHHCPESQNQESAAVVIDPPVQR
jgi:hypothetical protein